MFFSKKTCGTSILYKIWIIIAVLLKYAKQTTHTIIFFIPNNGLTSGFLSHTFQKICNCLFLRCCLKLFVRWHSSIRVTYSCQDEGSRGTKCWSRRSSFVICIIEFSSTTQLYCHSTCSLKDIGGVDWAMECVIFFHIQCEALEIYMHVLFACSQIQLFFCSSSSTCPFRKSTSQTSDHLLSSSLYMCSQELIIFLIRSWEKV